MSCDLVYKEIRKLGSAFEETVEVRVPLEARTKEEAVAEAKALWEKRVAEAEAQWQLQKKTWANPPKSPFEYGPSSPMVVLKIRI